MTWLEPVTLSSSRVRLELLDHRHERDLIEAVKDGELWRLWYTTIADPENIGADIDRRLRLYAAGTMLPFAVIEAATAKAVGMTTYMNVDTTNQRVEIGATWYRKSAQRTDLNTHCKLLLLTHAFEALDCIAVEFRTHFFIRAGAASSGSAPSSTASCAATSGHPTAHYETRASTASLRVSGQP